MTSLTTPAPKFEKTVLYSRGEYEWVTPGSLGLVLGPAGSGRTRHLIEIAQDLHNQGTSSVLIVYETFPAAIARILGPQYDRVHIHQGVYGETIGDLARGLWKLGHRPGFVLLDFHPHRLTSQIVSDLAALARRENVGVWAAFQTNREAKGPGSSTPVDQTELFKEAAIVFGLKRIPTAGEAK